MVNSIVQQIHADPELMGVVIEVGAGNPVASKLYAEAGASKTLIYSTVPNSLEFNQFHHDLSDSRAVSLDTAMGMLGANRSHNIVDNGGDRFAFSATCQIGPDCITHGWMVYQFKDKIGAFHYTFERMDLTRAEYIDAIGDLGVQIIAAKNQEPVINGLIDQIYRVDIPDESDVKSYTITSDIWAGLENLALSTNVNDQMIVLEINDNDNITYGRLETHYRTSDDFVVYKGSFNPIQEAHLELSNIMSERFPHASNMFSISVDTHEKGSAEIADLYYRIQGILRDTRKPIILNKRPLFSDFTSHLRHRGYKQRIHYPCGSDTIYRVLKLGYDIHNEDYNTVNHQWITFMYDNLGVEYHYRDRVGYKLPEIGACNNFKPLGVESNPISSTMIRNWVAVDDWESVAKHVPEHTFKILKDENYRNGL